MNPWVLAGTSFVTSSVEFVEAATIVLAVGFTQGWRAAIGGGAVATAALAVLVGLFTPLLVHAGALRSVQAVAGALLAVLGIAWLRKAVWRYGGRLPMRDERAKYANAVTRMRDDHDQRVGFATAFGGVFVEGLEVVVILMSLVASAHGAPAWTIGGALLAFTLVVLCAVVLRRPLASVPENAMKAFVGVMLLSLGTWWLGEGLGIVWRTGDASLLILIGFYAGAAWLLVAALRKTAAPPREHR